MASVQSGLQTVSRTSPFTIRALQLADLGEALAKGLDDFRAKRSDVIFLALIYPLIGLFLIRFTLGLSLLPLLFPLVAGFALVGPVAAIGFCELSRQREQGDEPSWTRILGIFRRRSLGDIVTLGVLHALIFVSWLGAAWAIYQATLGGHTPTSVTAFFREVLTTPSGWLMILVGNGVGFLFAVLVLSISVVSFPLLLDCEVDAFVAIRTSVKTVLANPVVMAVWGLIVGCALLVGCMLFLVGLAVVLPVLGHATWHLYRRVIVH